MDDQLKALMQDLGNAINESLSDSDRIGAAIGEIKRAGYNVFLVLEATIGFHKRDETDDDDSEDDCNNERSKNADSARSQQQHNIQAKSNAEAIRWTSQDEKFLKQMKIAPDGKK